MIQNAKRLDLPVNNDKPRRTVKSYTGLRRSGSAGAEVESEPTDENEY